jgi:hypothetical protein
MDPSVPIQETGLSSSETFAVIESDSTLAPKCLAQPMMEAATVLETGQSLSAVN